MDKKISRYKSMLEQKDLIIIDNIDEYVEFSCNKDIKTWSENLYLEWSEKIKKFYVNVCQDNIIPFYDDDYSCLYLYCGYSHKNINKLLRKTDEVDNKNHFRYMNMSQFIAIDMLSAPRVDRNIISFRFIDDFEFEKIVTEIKDKGYYIDKGFMSTTLLKRNSEQINELNYSYLGNNYVLKLYIKKGTIGVYCPLVSGRLFEQELLLFHSCSLKPIKFPYYDEEMRKVIFECSVDNICYNEIVHRPYDCVL